MLRQKHRKPFLILLELFTAVALLTGHSILAAVYTWQVPSGDWSVASNWGGLAPSSSNDNAYILNGGTAMLTQPALSCGTLTLGGHAGNGTVQMTGTTLASIGTVYVGSVTGDGTFAQSSGTNNVTNLYLAIDTASSGSYSLSGSSVLSSATQYIGFDGTASFTQSGGTNTHPGGSSTIYVGHFATGSGTYSLGGAGAVRTSFLTIGNFGNGTFIQSSGSVFASNNITLGWNSGAVGSYNLSGPSQVATGEEEFGNLGTATFTQTGGTNNAENFLNLGQGGTASYALGGTGLLMSQTEYVPYGGSGILVQTGGTNSVGKLEVGYGSSGTYTLSSSGLLSADNEFLGDGSSGTLTQSGGTNAASSVNFGWTNSAAGNTGTYNLNGGLLLIQGFGRVDPVAAFFNFSGGTFQPTGTIFTENVAIQFGAGGTGAVFNTAGYRMNLSGSAYGLGGFTKVGGGTLGVSGSNSYTGPTTVNQGELLVNGSIASSVTVNDGGLLAGAGSLTSVTVNLGGQLAPGNPLGLLQLSGTLSLVPGAVMDYELDTPLDSSEVYMPSSLLSLNDQQFSDFNFTPLGGFGQGTYDLIAFGSISGSLGANTSGTIGGLPASLAVQGDNLVLNVVPEPGTLALLAASMAGLLICICWRPRFRFAAFIAAFAVLPATLARADVFNMPSGQTSLQFVTVGDPGNVADPATGNQHGAVSYTFSMGTYDVTLSQYVQFLNAVAATDTYGLYNSRMSNLPLSGYGFSTQGISQSGSSGDYSYSVTGSAPGAADMPVFDVSWGDAARFCNWLDNGQPTGPEGPGTTETGAYNLSGATSQAALAMGQA